MSDDKPRRPTIIDGRYAHTSASQVNDWKRCPRIWYNKKVLKIDVPSTPAQERGSRIHSAIEYYLKNKIHAGSEWDTYVYAAQPSLPTGAYSPEHEVLLDTFVGGPLYVGYIDVFEKNRILDYKSTSDFRYCKTPSELEVDTQLGAYAYWYFQQHTNATSVEVAHLYLLTRGKTPKANYVSGTHTRETAREVWDRDLRFVKEISETVRQLVPKTGPIEDRSEELTPNVDACDMYGGCAFRSKCGLGETLSKFNKKPERLFQIEKYVRPEEKKEMGMTLAEKLAAKAAANRAADSNPEAIQKRSEEELAKRINEAPEKFESKDKPGDAKKVTEDFQKVREDELLAQLNDEEPMGIAPPDAPKQEVAKAVVEDKPKRGRPPKAKEEKIEVQDEKIDSPVLGRKEFRLFIDTFPIKGPSKSVYVLFEDWIVPIAQKVAEDHGQPDWRYIQYTAKAALVREIKNRLDQLPQSMVVMSYAPGADAMMEVGIPLATEVFRGK